VCPNTNKIEIYETKNWTKLHTLTEHDLVVTSIDWSAANNKIVTCSQDRNAFVWTYIDATADEPASWKPALVLMNINRAAMDVKWALDGQRFAIGSGDKCVAMCTYDPAGDWWVSKLIKKKIKSTVICVAFHPRNGQVLATGAADFKVRIFSTYSADVDGSGMEDVHSYPFSKPVEFGECYVEMSANSWINALAWSPSGDVLCFASHDSCIHFASNFGPAAPVVQTLKLFDMPLCSMLFVAEKAVVAGGHDFIPFLFTQGAGGGGQWSLTKKLDEKKTAVAAATTGVGAARALFQNKTSRGQASAAESDSLWTCHENAIVDMHDASPAGSVGNLKRISTTALDGRLTFWDLTGSDLSLASLSI